MCIERFNIVKMSVLLKLIYKFKAFSIKVAARFFVDKGRLILKLTWKGTGTSNNNLNKKE